MIDALGEGSATRVRKKAVSNRIFVAMVAICGLFAPSAHARTIDRVAAIAGSHVIFLSEVRDAAAPYLRAVNDKDAIARARAETKVLHETCERMIDDALVQDEAERQHLTVTDDSVQRAISQIAQSNNVSVEQLLAVAMNEGLDERGYRASVRNQLLSLRLLQARGVDPNKYDQGLVALHADLRALVYVEDRLA